MDGLTFLSKMRRVINCAMVKHLADSPEKCPGITNYTQNEYICRAYSLGDERNDEDLAMLYYDIWRIKEIMDEYMENKVELGKLYELAPVPVVTAEALQGEGVKLANLQDLADLINGLLGVSRQNFLASVETKTLKLKDSDLLQVVGKVVAVKNACQQLKNKAHLSEFVPDLQETEKQFEEVLLSLASTEMESFLIHCVRNEIFRPETNN